MGMVNAMIRLMKKSETYDVMDLWLRTSNYSNSFIKADFWETHYDYIKQKYIDKKDTFVYLKDGKIVGFTVVGADNEIGGLFVDPAYQNEGIGTELINFLKSEYPCLTSDVYARNRKAFQFSVDLGFTVREAMRHSANNEVMYRMIWNGDEAEDKEDDVKIWKK